MSNPIGRGDMRLVNYEIAKRLQELDFKGKYSYYVNENMVIKEEYCSCEASRMLKLVGFPQEEGYKYSYVTQKPMFVDDVKVGTLIDGCMVSQYTAVCPSQTQAMRWFRDCKGINVVILMGEDKKENPRFHILFQVHIKDGQHKNDYRSDSRIDAYRPSYEAAADLAIRRVCEYLLTQQRQKTVI